MLHRRARLVLHKGDARLAITRRQSIDTRLDIIPNKALQSRRRPSTMATASKEIEPVHTLIEGSPTISRNVVLHCMGDWGQVNWHAIMRWITQEFCERAGPLSRTAIWSVRGGGKDPIMQVYSGDADIAINIQPALTAKGFLPSPMIVEDLRGLATLDQNDRMVLGLDPSLGCKTFADLRQKKPKLKLAMCPDNGDSPIGFVAHRYLEAHGVSADDILFWGGEIVYANRPEECLIPCEDPARGFNAVIQEAIMTPWWRNLVDGTRAFVPLPAEPEALGRLDAEIGLPPSTLPAGYWKNLKEEIPALEFNDFTLFCRKDLPDDVVYLLTWVVVKTKNVIESQFHSFPGDRSPIGWPMYPEKMAKTSLPLHPAAERFYRENGYL